MDKGRHITRICFCLVAMVIITAPHGVISLPCTGGARNGQTVNSSGNQRTLEGSMQSPGLVVPAAVPATPSAIKKDLFMSRGWGASGMPFSMYYLNHYSKAQKAYAQSQLQQQQQQQLQQQQLLQQQQQLQWQAQQQQQQQQQEQLPLQQDLQRIQEEQQLLLQKELHKHPVPLPDGSANESANPGGPYASRYEPEVVAVHAQQLRTDTDYVDSSPSVRTTSKVNTARRQYTVPQLFVSYGWGPMG